MKYLIINGSPRKGNTWKLVEVAKAALMKYDTSYVFDEIQLIGLNLPFCTGCSNCFRKGGTFCPHYEILSSILEKNGAGRWINHSNDYF